MAAAHHKLQQSKLRRNTKTGGFKMKKLLISTALIGLIGFAGIQMASAHGYGGYGYCGDFDRGYTSLNDKDKEALEKFEAETASIRKEIVVKRSELNALMRQDNPDAKRVAQLTGELYDLQTGLDNKAESTGVEGFGEGHRGGYGYGMMWGNSWHRSGHMMDW
jgi:hypothetical protein